MMRRTLSAAATAALLSTLVLAGSVSAAPPIGGCPPGGQWELVYPTHQPQAQDHNGDGWLCRANFFVGPGILPIDNVVNPQ